METVDFVCTTKDCSQRAFVDEKSFSSQRKKPDMAITLNKPTHFSADETPTPTSLIRNLEDIGLFKDLNPFEETFKKAAEASQKGHPLNLHYVSSLGRPAGEDLHTPHIDLNHEDQSSSTSIESESVFCSEDGAPRKINISYSPKILPTGPRTTTSVIDKSKASEHGTVLVKLPDFTLVQTLSSQQSRHAKCQIASSTSTTVLTTQKNLKPIAPKVVPVEKVPLEESPKPSPNSASVAVKQKLKAALLRSSKEIIHNPAPISTPVNSAHHERAGKERKVTSTTIDNEDYVRKLTSLEKNRLAAMKSRQKRKKFINDLKEKYAKVCSANVALTKEVTFLREEVMKLKNALLLAYNNPHSNIQEVNAVSAENLSCKETPSNMDNAKPSNSTINVLVTVPPREAKLQLQASQPVSKGRGARRGLSLNIEEAASACAMDLDSPLVMRDEILSSVAPPTTPNERLISFPLLDRVEPEVPPEDKILSSVIQVNPNALTKFSVSS